MTDSLRCRWNDLKSRIQQPDQFVDDWSYVVSAYNSPGRHYHTLSHIEACFREFDEIKERMENPLAVEVAIWFHDIEYDVFAKDNEEVSAVRAHAFLCLNQQSRETADRTFSLICLTKGHMNSALMREPEVIHAVARQEDGSRELVEDAKYFLDIDLSILGQPPEVFKEYEKNIREEYIFVANEVFYPTRKKILQGFLAAPRIFKSDHFYQKYETQARTNIQTLLQTPPYTQDHD